MFSNSAIIIQTQWAVRCVKWLDFRSEGKWNRVACKWMNEKLCGRWNLVKCRIFPSIIQALSGGIPLSGHHGRTATSLSAAQPDYKDPTRVASEAARPPGLTWQPHLWYDGTGTSELSQDSHAGEEQVGHHYSRQ